jgi:hypothetical protein
MRKDVFDKAYGHIPKEISPSFDFDMSPWRGIKYHWILLKRKYWRSYNG